MKNFKDLFGNSLYNADEIDECKNFIDCDILIERHRQHLIESLSDAEAHLNRFKIKVGVF